MISLQRRLNAGLGIALILLMTLLWWVASTSLEHIGRDLTQSRLEHDAESLLSALSLDAEGRMQIDAERAGGIYERAFSGHYYIIQSEHGQRLRSRSLWDEDLGAAMLETGSSRTWDQPGPEGQRLVAWARAYRKHGTLYTIAVAEDITPLLEDLGEFHGDFAVGGLVMLIVLLAVQRLVVRRSLRTLDQVRQELDRLEHGEAQSLAAPVPQEIQPLVDAFNRLLRLLGQRLAHSRNSLGNLAHALKHPLHLLMQYAAREELRAHPEIQRGLLAQGEQLRQLIERELKRARLAGAGSPGRRFAPAEDMPTLLDLFRQIHHAKGLAIDYDGPPDAMVAADRDDMLELLGNLLDNACKWARGSVTCRIRLEDGLRIIIDDDGPGCSDEDLAKLTGRGVRIDESSQGHGLGLAIVKDIVDLYGGELRMERSPSLGGLRVDIRLPVSGARHAE